MSTLSPPPSGADSRRILLVGLIGLLGALVLAGVNLWSLGRMNAAADDIDDACRGQKAGLDVRADIIDLKRLQSRYLLAVEGVGTPGVEREVHRRAYLAGEARLERRLREFPALQRPASRSALQSIREEYGRFQGLDARIAALVADGTPSARAQAVAIGLREATRSAAAMTRASDELVASIDTRILASRATKESTARQARIVVFVALLVVLTAIGEIARIVAGPAFQHRRALGDELPTAPPGADPPPEEPGADGTAESGSGEARDQEPAADRVEELVTRCRS